MKLPEDIPRSLCLIHDRLKVLVLAPDGIRTSVLALSTAATIVAVDRELLRERMNSLLRAEAVHQGAADDHNRRSAAVPVVNDHGAVCGCDGFRHRILLSVRNGSV
jgi:hypothetical protein